jgi:hypothetical protein
MKRTFNSARAALVLGIAGAVGTAACSNSSDNGSTDDAGSTAKDDGSTPLGPGAALVCPSSGKNAWDTYGKAAFVAVNESIFTNVNADIGDAGTTNLGTAFTKIGSGNPPSTSDNLATFKGSLAAFLVYAYGGPTSIVYTDGVTYTGPQDMVAAHTGLAITTDQYNYFVSNIIVPALTSNGVPLGDVTTCFAPVVTNAAFMASVVGH